MVDSAGTGVIQFKPGDEVFGVTNKQFCGAYAEYSVASAQMVAARPRSLSFVEAASAPVVAVTAYEMLFDHAQMKAGQAGINPRSGRKCWRVCGATGEAGRSPRYVSRVET
jgi:NADPH:quinone reductase-like Zn-dependent oxidoreductase